MKPAFDDNFVRERGRGSHDVDITLADVLT